MNNGDQKLTKGENGEPRGDREFIASAPSLDLAKYRDLAGDLEIPNEDFDAFLRTLWDIMSAFVQHGFDVKTIPVFFPEIFDDASDTGARTVESEVEETDDDA